MICKISVGVIFNYWKFNSTVVFRSGLLYQSSFYIQLGLLDLYIWMSKRDSQQIPCSFTSANIPIAKSKLTGPLKNGVNCCVILIILLSGVQKAQKGTWSHLFFGDVLGYVSYYISQIRDYIQVLICPSVL